MNSDKTQNAPARNHLTLLWVLTGVSAIGLLFARVVFSEILWPQIVLALLLLAALVGLIREYKISLRNRATAYGLNSIVTVILVIGIVGVLNFLADKYPAKLDLTKNKINTLSDQSIKVVKDLKVPVRATLFGKPAERDRFRPLLERYRALNPKFEIEYVDPDRDITRVQAAKITKYNTLQLVLGTRDDKLDDVTEERITNSLIKLQKDKLPTLCWLTGHGEPSLSSREALGYEMLRETLEKQSYQFKEISLLQEGKVPEVCDAIATVGATKSFFDQEIKLLDGYLDGGGRVLIATDQSLTGKENAPELDPVEKKWFVQPVNALVLDPSSIRAGGDAAIPLISDFSKDHPITKPFDIRNTAAFPTAHPLKIVDGAPAGLNIQWLARSSKSSWAESRFDEMKEGKLKVDPSKVKMEALDVAIAVEGKQKDSKAPRSSRLVAFGCAAFAANGYSKFGGNLDFMANAVSWLLQDESVISIRPREDANAKLDLSQRESGTIMIVTVILVPLLMIIAGIVIWVRRKKL